MGFLRKLPETPATLKEFQGGKGYVEKFDILNGAEEMKGAGRVFSIMRLQPGCEVGEHTHHGDCETYYFLKGTGLYRMNGETMQVSAGDIAFCDDGDTHYVCNNGAEELEFLAVILYTK